MNKFDFIAGKKQTTEIQVSSSSGFCKDYKRKFCFKFNSENHSFGNNIIRESQRDDYDDNVNFVTHALSKSHHCVVNKTEINQNVTRQLKEMMSIVKKDEELLYVKMNKTTKDKFRIYYSYEVSCPPRNLNSEDKEVGSIVGSIMGMKIIQDESIQQDTVVPVVRYNIKSKFYRVFEQELIGKL